MRTRAAASVLLVLPVVAQAADGRFDFSGDLRTRGTLTTFPHDSLLRDLAGPTAGDFSLLGRLKFAWDQGDWDLLADYQAALLYGDRIDYTRDLPPGSELFIQRLPSDRTRLFDLTSIIGDRGRQAAFHRLDRLSVGYTRRKAVLRFGRQAVTWGNGMLYTPMDIFNPFDPAAVDTEYKTGDDMLYGQYLRDNGDDWQSVLVFRRNPVTGDLERDLSSLALKYHGFGGDTEYDLLAAEHYDEPLVGIGGNASLGGAVWRGDLTVAFTEEDDAVASLVTSLSYSWTWGGKNISGVAEYFFNGFGQSDGDYDPASLAANPELLSRIARNELYTLGRHYSALSATVEMTPLFLIIPAVFVNLSDGSALAQLVTQSDLRENLLLLGALNLPIGAKGTEFGGIETGVPGSYLSSGLSLFAQLNWYF